MGVVPMIIKHKLKYLYRYNSVTAIMKHTHPHTYTNTHVHTGLLKYNVRHVKIRQPGANLRMAFCCPSRLVADLNSPKTGRTGMEAICTSFPPIVPYTG